MRMLALVMLLSACPGKGPVETAHTAAGPKPCEKMADHLVSLMNPKDPKDGKPVERHDETADAITRVIIERCTQDKWTIDAQQCFQGLGALTESDRCAPLLTVDQRNSMDKAMEALFGPEPAAGSAAPASP
jgi:hypothetical protein